MNTVSAMRQETVDEHTIDFLWPPTTAAQWMHRGGIAVMGIGAAILVGGLWTGVEARQVFGIDLAFVACGGVIAGLLAWSYGSARAVARRIRIDRRSRTIERAKQAAKGSWQTDIALSFDECATLAIVEDDVDDRASSFDIVATTAAGQRVRLWPVTLPTRRDAEEALAALHGAVAAHPSPG